MALKMHSLLYIPSNPYAHMKKFFTPFFFILLLFTGAKEAFGENLLNYPGPLEIKLVDFLRSDLRLAYNFSKASQIWKLQLENYQGAKNRQPTGIKPILNLGTFPDVLLKYQSDTVIQWGYTLHDLTLSLRIGVKAEDFNYLDFQTRRENNTLLNVNLNFNFLIDFWFK